MLPIWGPRLWWRRHSLGHVLVPVEVPEGEQKHTMPRKASAGNYWPTVASPPTPVVQAGHMPKAKVNMAGFQGYSMGRDVRGGGEPGIEAATSCPLEHACSLSSHGNTLVLASRQPKRSIDLWHRCQDPQHVQI